MGKIKQFATISISVLALVIACLSTPIDWGCEWIKRYNTDLYNERLVRLGRIRWTRRTELSSRFVVSTPVLSNAFATARFPYDYFGVRELFPPDEVLREKFEFDAHAIDFIEGAQFWRRENEVLRDLEKSTSVIP